MAAITSAIRDIHNSVFARIETLLESPPAATGLSAYTVYKAADLRAVQKQTLTPVFPRVFLVDRKLRPAEPSLPMLVVETEVKAQRYELGNKNGKLTFCRVYIFGRQSSEVQVLASLIQDHFEPLTIDDYSDPDSVVTGDSAMVSEIDTEFYDLDYESDDWRVEGSLSQGMLVSWTVKTRN